MTLASSGATAQLTVVWHPSWGVLKSTLVNGRRNKLSGKGTFLQIPESIIPGCKQFTVTPEKKFVLFFKIYFIKLYD